jgi:hypothetical protein
LGLSSFIPWSSLSLSSPSCLFPKFGTCIGYSPSYERCRAAETPVRIFYFHWFTGPELRRRLYTECV